MLEKLKLQNAPQSVISSLKSLSEKYSITQYLEKGSNGFLFFGENSILNRKIAIKYYYWGGDKQYHTEPEFLAKFSNGNILKIHHAEAVCDEWSYFISDYCKHGDLDDYCISKSKLSVKTSLRFINDILNGLSYLHSKLLVHRDLKPQNILINDKKQPVIGDFGSVKRFNKKFVSDCSGHSIIYRPPESFNLKLHTMQSDIYQVGIVLYQLIGGKLSYNQDDYLNGTQKKEYEELTDECDKSLYVDGVLSKLITKGKLLDFDSIPCWVSPKIVSIIKKATNINPSKRYINCSSMMNDINKIKDKINDWSVEGEALMLKKDKSYRITKDKTGFYFVEKKKHSDWRIDNSFGKSKNIADIVKQFK